MQKMRWILGGLGIYLGIISLFWLIDGTLVMLASFALYSSIRNTPIWLGNIDEIKALYTALNGGVSLITTVHGDSIEDIRNRKELSNLLDSELFKKVIILSAKKGPGTIEKIYDLEEKRWYFAN